MAGIIQPEDLDPSLPVVGETVLDPETDQEIVFRANSQEEIEELVDLHWNPE